MPPHPVTDYANRVLAGEAPACEHVRRACQRHLADLERDDLVFDGRAADFVFAFLRLCKHHKGEWAGSPIELHESQQFIVGSLFGWKHKATGLRRFRTAYIEVPRKNGKSTLSSAIALFLLVGDGEPGAEIYAAATKEDQAKIVWKAAWEMAKRSPSLNQRCTTQHNSILVRSTASIFRPLGADSTTLDGLNPHGVICDELHAWPSRDLWDVLDDALGARSQPMMVAITTAGYNRNGICYEIRNHALQVVDPKGYEDDKFFAYVASIDEGDDWADPKTWYKANPLLGVSKKLEYMEGKCADAIAMPGKENAFLNKQLDVWTDGATKWMRMDRWDECAGEVEADAIKSQRCYVGLDLSSSIDITAAVYAFPPGPYEEWAIKCRFFIPEENVRDRVRRDKVPYDQWIREGWVETTPGDIVDLDFIRRDIIDHGGLFDIREIGYDPWKATELATSLDGEGFTMVEMRQGHRTLAGPMKALLEKVIRREMRHSGNPVLRWMASNTVARADANDNLAPDKKTSPEKIDGIVALIMALGRAIANGEDEVSAYETEGIKFL